MHTEHTHRIDAVFDVLSHATRRRLLYYLREHGTATPDELADVLAGWRATERGDSATADQRRGLALDLHHQHLPALRDVGLVDRDPATDVVELRDRPAWIDRCLDVAFDVEIREQAAVDPFDRWPVDENE